jgi:hypothetical protein
MIRHSGVKIRRKNTRAWALYEAKQGRKMVTETQQETEQVEQPEQHEDKLAIFRQQVKDEAANKVRGKMSEEALAKLRAIREQERIAAASGVRFKHALQSVIVTTENLKKLIDRCYPQGFTIDEAGFQPCGRLGENGEFISYVSEVKHLDRRARKLSYWINAGFRLGHEIETPAQIRLCSELTDEEIKMSDSRFANEWDMEAAAKVRKSRINRGLIEEVISTPGEPAKSKLCKSGKLCLRYSGRKAAPVPSQGQYCSRNCAASFKIRSKSTIPVQPTITVLTSGQDGAANPA